MSPEEILVTQVLWFGVMIPDLLITLVVSRLYVWGMQKIFHKPCYFTANLLSFLTVGSAFLSVYYFYAQDLSAVLAFFGSVLTLALAQSVWLVWDYRYLIGRLAQENKEFVSERNFWKQKWVGTVAILAVFGVLTFLGKGVINFQENRFVARMQKIMAEADELYVLSYIWGEGLVEYCQASGVKMENYSRFYDEKLHPLHMQAQKMLCQAGGVDDFEKLVNPKLLDHASLSEKGKIYLEDVKNYYKQKSGNAFSDKAFCEDMEKHPEKFFSKIK